MPKPKTVARINIVDNQYKYIGFVISQVTTKKGNKYSFELGQLFKQSFVGDVIAMDIFQVVGVRDAIYVDDKIEFYLNDGVSIFDIKNSIKDVLQKVYDSVVKSKTTQAAPKIDPIIKAVPTATTSNILDLSLMTVESIINRLNWSDGLKQSMIMDFVNSGYVLFKDLVRSNAKETSQAIQEKIYGFPSGKNTYLQANMIAEELFKLYKPKGSKGVKAIIIKGVYQGEVAEVLSLEKTSFNPSENLYKVEVRGLNANLPRNNFFVVGDTIAMVSPSYRLTMKVTEIDFPTFKYIMTRDNTEGIEYVNRLDFDRLVIDTLKEKILPTQAQAAPEPIEEEKKPKKDIYCVQIGDSDEAGRVGKVVGIDVKFSAGEENILYLVEFKDETRSISRQEFIVEGDIVRFAGDEYAELVLSIDNSFIQLKTLNDADTPNISKYEIRYFNYFKGCTIEQYYQLHEIFDSKQMSKPAAKTLSDDEKEIEALKKDVANLVFLKSTFSPIEFEETMKVGQKIDEKQKKINELNVVVVDKKLKGNKIFDDLFEQSFTDIKNSYNVYVESETENTEFFAPNGVKSELKNSINSIIRTPLFKDWFGDWQLAYQYRDIPNSGVSCSKVVNKNFEPLVVWHGTGTEFSYFKFDKFPAAYFAVNKNYSEWFANLQSGGGEGYTLPFFLNLRNPLDLTKFGTNEIKGQDFLDYLFVMTGMSPEELEINPIFLDPNTPKVQTWVYIRNSPKMLKKLAESHVFDGIHFYETNPSVPLGEDAHETEAYITFKPDSCKIADPERGELVLAAMKSFLLKKGGEI